MKLKTGDYVYQTEDHLDRQLRRLRTITRRKVISVTDDRVALAGAERLTTFLDADTEPGEWIRTGLVMSRDICLTWDTLAAQGWKTGFSMRSAA